MRSAIRAMETASAGRGMGKGLGLTMAHHQTLTTSPLKTKTLIIDNSGRFIERDTGRVFHIHGINFSSSTKLPDYPLQNTHTRPEDCGFYDDADNVGFANRPFPTSSAYEHLSRIKQCGFNTVRFVTPWEALEHEGPGIYDMEYIEYITNLLKVVEEVGGLYVFIDPHQDVWSRFCGGSGAPIWTLYAAGLEPRHFEDTLACKLHHLAEDPEQYTKMVWATNYNRLASEVMFTMFFSGKTFLPKAEINGVNIQTYLQTHFTNAFTFLLRHLKEQAPEVFGSCLLGVESMNEPNSGLFGMEDLNKCPDEQKLKLDETPTPIQSFRLGMGTGQQIDTYSLSVFGPTKNGSKWIDPKGTKAWIEVSESKDKHYGFDRSPNWKLGECIFEQHGIWDSSNGALYKPHYFNIHPETGEVLNENKFINSVFLDFWEHFRTEMRKVDDEMILVLQPPVLQIPPKIENNRRYVDSNTAVALHYYDGMSLMFQKWNRMFNVDTLGIMRGKYINPVFGLNLGEKNIRKSIHDQLKSMVQESNENCGYEVPVIFTETGMPFNMDNKKAYKNGKYDSQEAANDAIMSGLENEQFNFTYWCYNPTNSHTWGDYWNLEDFSIWSKDGVADYRFNDASNYHEWLKKNSSEYDVLPATGTSNDDDSADTSYTHSEHSNESITKNLLKESTVRYADNHTEIETIDLTEGVRAINAIIRPSPYLVNGIVNHCQFDVKSKSFNLKIISRRPKTETAPDIITLPRYHYRKNQFKIHVSHGTYEVHGNRVLQWVEWDHSNLHDVVVEMNIHVIENGEEVYEDQDCDTLKGLACGCL